MKSLSELIAAQKRVEAIYPEARAELMKLPGVVKVGIGIKEKDGELTDETVIRVYVEEKKDPADIPPGEMIPKVIFGVRTDVVIVRPQQPEDDESRYRPLKAGVQINRADSNEVGTLGCFGHLESDDTVVILTNHHVLYGLTASSGADGVEVGQPTHSTSCCCTCGDIATNVHGIRHDHLDVAIARLKQGVAHDARIKEIGFITGIANAVAGQNVKKRGRTTGLTTGKVTNLTKDAGGTKILEIEVKKNNGNERFSRGGDSGSALLNDNNEIIGLHKEGNNGDDVQAGNFLSTSIGIQEVLDALEADNFRITLITGTGGDESAVLEAEQIATSDPFWAIEERFKKSEPGRRLWEVVRRNQKEALRLVNEERRVTVVWQRHKGPVFLAALGRSVKEPAYEIPRQIEGVTRREAGDAVLAALRTHAGESFRADLEAYGPELIAAFEHGDTLEQVVRNWEEAAEGAALVTE